MADAPDATTPCGCPAAVHPEFGDGHSVAQHRLDSCQAWPPCGGCYDCLAAQAAHFRGKP